MTTAAASDPFGSTANPASYVARPASERALAAVELALVQGHGPVAITGPAGLGKTVLLAVLGERLRERFHVVRVPYPALSSAEICRWVLESLGAPPISEGEDPEGVLLDRAFRGSAGGREILLLVDDASSLPPRTARGLATLVSASGGAIRAVLAAVDDARLGAALAALGAGVREVRYDEPMSAEETAAYVRARLADPHAAGGRAAVFDADTLARVYGATGGITRRVHELGSILWRSEEGVDVPVLIERWVRDAEDREADPLAEAIEIDAEAEPVLELAGDEPESFADLGPLGEPEASTGSPESSAAPSEPPRTRGVWFVVAALAVLAVAMPYVLPELERLVSRALPDEPTTERQASPEIRPPRPASPEPATSPLAAERARDTAERAAGPAPEQAEGALVSVEPEAESSFETREDEDAIERSEGEPAEVAEPEFELPTEPAPKTALESAGVEPDAAPESPAAEAPLAAPEPAPVEPEPAALDAEEATAAAAEPSPALAEAEPVAPRPRRVRPAGIPVRVEANPSATIHIDGGLVGRTPLRGLELRRGLHVIRAEFPDGRAVVRAVEVSKNTDRIYFEPSPDREPDVELPSAASDGD
ncbi:MAG: AAA family ATPase [Deltaproteobacteria bacterium]|nr:AAA family ATPase [Deltaproteobacteria bacterium]